MNPAGKSRWEMFAAALFLQGIGLLAAYFQGRGDGEQAQLERVAESSARNGNGEPCADCPEDQSAVPHADTEKAPSVPDLGLAPTPPSDSVEGGTE